jgi:hypothetical protein
VKVLQVTSMPPCRIYMAGLRLEGLCSFLLVGSLAGFRALHPHIASVLLPMMEVILCEDYKPPREYWSLLPGKIADLKSLVVETKFFRQSERRQIAKTSI